MAKDVFSIRLEKKTVATLDGIAKEIGSGATRTSIIIWACEWYIEAYKAHGSRPLIQSDMEDLMRYIRKRSPSS